MVNIKDYKTKQIEGDKLDLIFDRQKELMEKYHPIEDKNGLLITKEVPINLHDSKGQFRIKDFAWRVTEELGEALEAFEIHPELTEHYDEEVADALHFLVELTILGGMIPEKIITIKRATEQNNISEDVKNYFNPLCGDKLDFLYEYAWGDINQEGISALRNYSPLVYFTGKVTQKLGNTCNTLKNKPWKQSQILTDIKEFEFRLRDTWVEFIKLCICANILPEKLFALYFRKSEVNKFRIRSKY
jgi:hypothetical protein